MDENEIMCQMGLSWSVVSCLELFPAVEFEGVEVTEQIDDSELLSLLLWAETAAVHVASNDLSRLEKKTKICF